MSTPVVLLVNCPDSLQPALRQALQDLGIATTQAADAAADLVAAWLDPRSQTELAALRQRPQGASPAVLVVGPEGVADAYLAAAAAGADGYTTAPEPAVIAAQCRLLLGSRARFAEVSPLTGLAGNNALQKEIERRLPKRSELAVLAFDVDNFKGYNDRYGYERGDRLLRHACTAMMAALAQCAAPGWFAAHLGGDDFLALVRPQEAAAVARRTIELFAAGLAGLYEPADYQRGFIAVRTRTGEVCELPLATLTVAAVTNEADDLVHAGQLAAVLAELKAYGKSLKGSSYVPDRRRDHSGAADCSRRV